LFRDIGQRGIFPEPLVLDVLRWTSVFEKQDENWTLERKLTQQIALWGSNLLKEQESRENRHENINSHW